MRVNSPVTLSNENGPSRSRPCRHPSPVANGRQRPASGGRMANDTGPGFSGLGGSTGATMASVGIRRRVSRRTGQVTYQVWWLLDDRSQGAETVASKDQARALAAQKRLQITRDTWQGRRRGRLPFSTWADLWWADWSADPHRSPHTLVMAESRLRNHVRPVFGDRAIDRIGPADIRRWQTHLAAATGHATVQQCRSLLLRIFQYAVDEGALDANPVRKVAVPKRRADPEKVFGQAKTPSAHPRGSRPAARPLPPVLVGPRPHLARHRPAVRRARGIAPPPRPPRPHPAGGPGGRHPLPGRPLRQRLQTATQERRRHP